MLIFPGTSARGFSFLFTEGVILSIKWVWLTNGGSLEPPTGLGDLIFVACRGEHLNAHASNPSVQGGGSVANKCMGQSGVEWSGHYVGLGILRATRCVVQSGVSLDLAAPESFLSSSLYLDPEVRRVGIPVLGILPHLNPH